MTIFNLLLITLLLAGCAGNLKKNDAAVLPPVEVAAPALVEEPTNPRIALYWEHTDASHPERAPWTDALVAEIRRDLAKYEAASDITTFCPKFKKLDTESKIKAIGELWVGITYYESGFDPQETYRECSKTECKYGSGCNYIKPYGYCMKGPAKYDNGMVVSKGLGQMSIGSSLDYGCDLEKPDDLYNPIKNLVCANKIMGKQIARTGKMTGSSNYWAVLKGSYSKNHISDIAKRVKRYAISCN